MRILGAAEAAALVPDDAVVVVDGSGGGVNQPDALLAALADRFASQASPTGLTIMHPSGLGDGRGGGVDRLADAALVRRVIAGHWGWTPKMQKLALAGHIEAYCLPQGVMSHWMREVAGGRPGVLTPVGIGTACDPRIEGGKLNLATTEDLVELLEIHGRDYLFYRAFPVDVAIIKGSYADENGNVCLDDEGLFAEALSVAQAAHNSGGVVLVQVNYLVAAGTVDPRRVKVPGILVDALVVEPHVPLSAATPADPSLTGDARVVRRASTDLGPLTERLLIARRAAAEVNAGEVINLGYGMPDGVASVLDAAGLADHVVLTVEQGHVGGIPASGTDFGLVRNADASLDAGYQFDFYDGGGLDLAVLSFAQVDVHGNVNVGRFGERMPGIGGFVNISQGAKRVVFVGTFTTARGDYRFSTDGVHVPRGGAAKFVPEVEQISFSAAQARAVGKPVRYVTERAVFELGDDGPELVEIAPDIDLRRDILDQMGFRPRVSDRLRRMDPWLFDPAASYELRRAAVAGFVDANAGSVA